MREDINSVRLQRRPSYDPPELPQLQASNLWILKSHKEAMRSDVSEIRKDVIAREHHCLRDAGTFEPV